MRICDLSILSGLSRQWVNKLVDKGEVPGCRRKSNGRLKNYDDEKAAEWASRMGKRSEQAEENPLPALENADVGTVLREGLKPFFRWALRARSKESHKARVAAYEFVLTGYADEAKSIAGIARQYGITRQALSKALKTAGLPPEIVGARVGRRLRSTPASLSARA
jgi:hypothetical protein